MNNESFTHDEQTTKLVSEITDNLLQNNSKSLSIFENKKQLEQIVKILLEQNEINTEMTNYKVLSAVLWYREKEETANQINDLIILELRQSRIFQNIINYSQLKINLEPPTQPDQSEINLKKIDQAKKLLETITNCCNKYYEESGSDIPGFNDMVYGAYESLLKRYFGEYFAADLTDSGVCEDYREIVSF
ncbi:MAG: hypothetical protein AAGF07_04190 [Patescibacteria group bacterium]